MLRFVFAAAKTHTHKSRVLAFRAKFCNGDGCYFLYCRGRAAGSLGHSLVVLCETSRETQGEPNSLELTTQANFTFWSQTMTTNVKHPIM